jgi:hypothetical protein
MKIFIIRWLIELLLLVTLVTLIMLAEPAWVIGFVYQVMFIVMVIVIGAILFSYEERIFINWLEHKSKSPDDITVALTIIERKYSTVYISYGDEMIAIRDIIRAEKEAEIANNRKVDDFERKLLSMVDIANQSTKDN